MSRFIVIFNQDVEPQQISAVLDTMQSEQAQLLQAWGESVLIAEGDAAVQDAVRDLDGIALVTDESIPSVGSLDIDGDARDLALAWNVGQSEEYQSAITDFLNTDVSFDGLLPPDGCNDGTNAPTDTERGTKTSYHGLLGIPANVRFAATLTHPERRALVGTIGVAVIQVDGPDGSDAAFAGNDWFTALMSLADGFSGLQRAAPSQAHLVFTTRVSRAKLALDPATVPSPADPSKPTPSEYETIEAAWRDPALIALGASTGRAGFRNLVSNSRFLFNVDWGYVVLITKYRAAWPAYGPNFRDVVVALNMVLNSPGLGIGALPVVFAHETGHTVGAWDEYPDSKCSVLQKCGYSNAPNGNCAFNNPFSVDCVMRGGSFAICLPTLSHFGWGDQDADGILDPYDPDFVFF